MGNVVTDPAVGIIYVKYNNGRRWTRMHIVRKNKYNGGYTLRRMNWQSCGDFNS